MTQYISSVIFGCSSLRLTQEEESFFKKVRPWGYILFSRNIKNSEQIHSLIQELREASGFEAPIFIDQEGGCVARIRSPLAREWQDISTLCSYNLPEKIILEALYLRSQWIAQDLINLSINVVCAPVMDILGIGKPVSPVLQGRILGDDPTVVQKRAAAVCKGLYAGGVLPVIKHFLGHGESEIDPHKGLPIVSAPLEQLERHDFSVFKQFCEYHPDLAPIGMTGHVVYKSIDPELPASQSSACVQEYIRKYVNFQHLLITDDIAMDALNGDSSARSQACLSAGHDIVLHCSAVLQEMINAMQSIPPLTDTRLERASQALASQNRNPESLDKDAANAFFLKHFGTMDI
jgi:beta-N-acetylhexosaminidase